MFVPGCHHELTSVRSHGLVIRDRNVKIGTALRAVTLTLAVDPRGRSGRTRLDNLVRSPVNRFNNSFVWLKRFV